MEMLRVILTDSEKGVVLDILPKRYVVFIQDVQSNKGVH